jgi:uncharacterized protein
MCGRSRGWSTSEVGLDCDAWGETVPAPGPFLTAQWRDLLMLNYAVAPELLHPFVPLGTALDLWRDVAYVTAVGFRFVDTRVLGLALPFHRSFVEVNLRFYVTRQTDQGPRRGVVFMRELVPRRAIALAARLIYNEPYRALPMRHEDATRGPTRRLAYEWLDAGVWSGLSGCVEGAPSPVAPGSEAEFITEHYWGYTRHRDGGTVEYQVAHPSWRVWDVRHAELHGNLASTYGSDVSAALSNPPQSAFVADGSAVTVYRPRRLDRPPGIR